MQIIRKSIFVGLGSTGVKAIAETKRMFEDSFGEGNIPPQVAFVALDFDRDVIDDHNLATDISAHFIRLPLTVNPFLIYHTRKGAGVYEWMLPQNQFYIPEFMECGSGQVRTNARLFADLVMPCLESAFDTAMANVLSLANTQCDYTVEHDDHVSVYLSGSLAGGTGSSLIMILAQMLKDRFPRIHLIGYGVMHSIFRMLDTFNQVTPRIQSNAYASLLELDYLQSASETNPVSHSLTGRPSVNRVPLFDEFYVVDNKNAAGEVITDFESLCRAIGCSMYCGGTELGKVHSIDWRTRTLSWGDKSSWVHSFGICQIVYKGKELESIYRAKAALCLVKFIRGVKQYETQRINAWMELNNLREDGKEFNKLIDNIYPSESISRTRTPDFNLSLITSSDDVKASLNKYAEKNAGLWPKNHVSEVIVSSVNALRNKIREILTESGGVSSAKSFLNHLETAFLQYKSEMEAEIQAYNSTGDSLQQSLMLRLEEYDLCRRKWYRRLLRKDRHCLELISNSAADCSRTSQEVARRQDAVTVFVTLLNEIRELTASVSSLDLSLQAIEDLFLDQIHQKELENEKIVLFEIDLSRNDRAAMVVDLKEDQMMEFYRMLPSSVLDMKPEDLERAVNEFTDGLHMASVYREREVMDVINNMDDREYEDLRRMIQRITSPLLCLTDRGLVKERHGSGSPISNMMKKLYVNVYSSEKDLSKSRLEEDKELFSGNNVHVDFVSSDCALAKQRILIRRVDSAIMPYCIESLDPEMEELYSNYNPHIDNELFSILHGKNHSFEPKG